MTATAAVGDSGFRNNKLRKRTCNVWEPQWNCFNFVSPSAALNFKWDWSSQGDSEDCLVSSYFDLASWQQQQPSLPRLLAATKQFKVFPGLPWSPLVNLRPQWSPVATNGVENEIDYAKFGPCLIGLLTGQPCSVCRQSPDYRCPGNQWKGGGVEQTEYSTKRKTNRLDEDSPMDIYLKY